MSGEDADERKANALKQSLEYLDLFLEKSPYVAVQHLTIADFSILASVTQLEGMEYRITAYPNLYKWVERLKSELPYYESCNTAGIEMFKTWAKSKNRTYTTKGNWWKSNSEIQNTKKFKKQNFIFNYLGILLFAVSEHFKSHFVVRFVVYILC